MGEIKIEPNIKRGEADHYLQTKNYMQLVIIALWMTQIIKAMRLQREERLFHLGAKRSNE